MDEYINLSMKQMDIEFKYYENEFILVLDEIGITKDTWDGSNETYIGNGLDDTEPQENVDLKEVEKKI